MRIGLCLIVALLFACDEQGVYRYREGNVVTLKVDSSRVVIVEKWYNEAKPMYTVRFPNGEKFWLNEFEIAQVVVE